MRVFQIPTYVLMSFALTGCGGETKAEVNPKADAQKETPTANKPSQPKPNSADFVFEDSTSADDKACQAALASIFAGKKETYCKNNAGVKTCQWLYLDSKGGVLYDQRANGDADNESRSRPLSCDKAMKMMNAARASSSNV